MSEYERAASVPCLTDYSRVEIGLKFKEVISRKAKENLKTHTENGYQGLSFLTEAVDTRKEVADLAGVSTGNVSKVECIQTHAPEEVKKQLRSDLNISSNLTESIDTRKEVSYRFRQY